VRKLTVKQPSVAQAVEIKNGTTFDDDFNAYKAKVYEIR
jgi:hypothetical protein